MINRRFGVALFSLLIFVASCSVDRDPCLLPKTTTLRIGTYQVVDTSNVVTDSLLPKPIWIAIDSNRGILFGEDISKFGLTLSSVADSCRYAIQPDSAVASFDTLTFYYQRRLQFLSNACSYTYYFNLTSVRTTYNAIDSLKITNTDVNSDANSQEHVQIFF